MSIITHNNLTNPQLHTLVIGYWSLSCSCAAPP